MLVIQDNVLPLVDGDVQIREPLDRRADQIQVPPALVLRPAGEEGAVDVAYRCEKQLK